jgi:hypothetical protein
MKRLYGSAKAPTVVLWAFVLAVGFALSGCGGADDSGSAKGGPPPTSPAGYVAPSEAKFKNKSGKEVNLIDESDGGDKGPAARRKRKS